MKSTQGLYQFLRQPDFQVFDTVYYVSGRDCKIRKFFIASISAIFTIEDEIKSLDSFEYCDPDGKAMPESHLFESKEALLEALAKDDEKN